MRVVFFKFMRYQDIVDGYWSERLSFSINMDKNIPGL